MATMQFEQTSQLASDKMSDASWGRFSPARQHRRGSGGHTERDRRWDGLMAKAQKGDRAAYDQLLREISPFIRGMVARQHNRHPDRVEDVLQDVLMALHRVRHTYDPARSFRHWLTAIVRHRSIDALRYYSRRTAIEVGQESATWAYESFIDPATNRIAEAQATADQLSKAIFYLPTLQREAVELLRLKDLSLVEASRLTGRSIAALKVNVHRALQSLQRQIAA
jgi:RNA polymerase sigma-70 factor (ECF subfamily)